jgi:hypothetical protein
MVFAFSLLFLSLVLSLFKINRLAFVLTVSTLVLVAFVSFLIYMDFPLGGDLIE